MADEILKALQASSYNAADSGYGIGVQGIGAALPNLVDPYASAGSNLGYVAGAGILGALLSGLAKQSAADDNAELLPFKQKLLDPATSAADRNAIVAAHPKLAPIQQQLMQQDYESALKVRDAIAVGKGTEFLDINKSNRQAQIDQSKEFVNATNQVVGREGKVFNPISGKFDQAADPAQYDAEAAARKVLATASPEAYAASLKEKEVARAKDEAQSGNTVRLPVDLVKPVTQSKQLIDEARHLSDVITSKPDLTWSDLQKAKLFSSSDKEGLGAELKNLADRFGRLRTGAVINPSEQKTFEQIQQGDITADPQQVASLLKKFAAAETRSLQSTLSVVDANERGGVNALRASLDSSVPPSSPSNILTPDISSQYQALRAQGLSPQDAAIKLGIQQ